MKNKYQQQLEILTTQLKCSKEQALIAQGSAGALKAEISDLEKSINLEIINSTEFIEEIKKLEFMLYFDMEYPKLVHEFSQIEKFPVEFNKVKFDLSSLKDGQIYRQENVYFDFPYRKELHICSPSMQDLLSFAKNHNLKWFHKSMNLLNQEIIEARDSLNFLNKFKRLMEKYKNE